MKRVRPIRAKRRFKTLLAIGAGRAKLPLSRLWGRHSCLPSFQPAAKKTGTTLTEVLMSLLIMGIGLVTVATIFPISVLRSIQATQLTRATALLYNVDAMIDIYPSIPNAVDRSQTPGEPKITIIDPLGWNLLTGSDDPTTYDFQTYFGGDQTNFGQPDEDNIFRKHAGFSTTGSAEKIATLPDSWDVIVDDVDITPGNTSVTFKNSNIDLTDLSLDDPVSRVILFDDSGSGSIWRYVNSSTATPVGVTATRTVNFLPALPTGFTVGRARVETEQRRYTWLLTARHRYASPVNYDVVVIFNRSFSVEDEQVFQLTYDPQDLSYRTYTVEDSPTDETKSSLANLTPPLDTKPFLKKGGWMFDMVNGRWYRLGKVDDSLNKITLESPPPDSDILPLTRGMFMRGVVEVYPIRSR